MKDGNKEGNIEKISTVVTSTWDVIYDPNTALKKLRMAAAKENGAKSKGLDRVWNLYYLHEYVHDIDVDSLEDFREEILDLVVKFRGATGWRSSDLMGVFLEHSITWVDADLDTPNKRKGVFLRAWSIKQGQGRWTGSTFIPALSPEFKNLCLCHALRRVYDKVLNLGDKVSKVSAITPDGEKTLLTPIFIFKEGKRKKISTSSTNEAYVFAPLKESTIANHFSEYFMQNTQATKGFKPHSCRNAVASLLHAMQVPAADIAAHMQTSAESLQATYIRTISDPYEPMPVKCIAEAAPLALKLWTAFVHHKTSEDGATCSCAKLLSSKSSMEEQRSDAEA